MNSHIHVVCNLCTEYIYILFRVCNLYTDYIYFVYNMYTPTPAAASEVLPSSSTLTRSLWKSATVHPHLYGCVCIQIMYMDTFLVCVYVYARRIYGSFCRGREGGSEGGRERGRERVVCICVSVCITHLHTGTTALPFRVQESARTYHTVPCARASTALFATSQQTPSEFVFKCVCVCCVCVCVCVITNIHMPSPQQLGKHIKKLVRLFVRLTVVLNGSACTSSDRTLCSTYHPFIMAYLVHPK
jgi:hypothetical protein